MASCVTLKNAAKSAKAMAFSRVTGIGGAGDVADRRPSVFSQAIRCRFYKGLS